MGYFNRMFLKITAVVLALVMCMIVSSCGKDDQKAETQTQTPTQSTTESKNDDKSTSDDAKPEDDINTSVDTRTPEDIGNAFMKAMYVDRDAKAVVDLIHKDDVTFMCNYTANTEQGAMTKDEFVEFVQGLIDEICRGVSEGYGDWTISYVCTDQRDSKDFEPTELELVEAHYKEANIEIEESKAVLMQGGIEYEENGELKVDDSVKVGVYVIKSDGKWYLNFDETLYIG